MHSGSIRDKALLLRRQKLGYGKIAKLLGVAKSTVALWLSGNQESEKIKKYLIDKNLKDTRKRIAKFNKVNAQRWQGLRNDSVKLAQKEFVSLWNNPLFASGISIYWGEGDSKEANPLRIANVDPRMIAVYCKFLQNIMKIPKDRIKLWLLLYPDLDDESCKEYWQKVSGLGRVNFVKSQYINGRHKTKRLQRGVCNVVVNSRYEKLKMLTWIDLFSKKITI